MYVPRHYAVTDRQQLHDFIKGNGFGIMFSGMVPSRWPATCLLSLMRAPESKGHSCPTWPEPTGSGGMPTVNKS